eukprot:gene13829-biopygen9560
MSSPDESVGPIQPGGSIPPPYPAGVNRLVHGGGPADDDSCAAAASGTSAGPEWAEDLGAMSTVGRDGWAARARRRLRLSSQGRLRMRWGGHPMQPVARPCCAPPQLPPALHHKGACAPLSVQGLQGNYVKIMVKTMLSNYVRTMFCCWAVETTAFPQALSLVRRGDGQRPQHVPPPGRHLYGSFLIPEQKP